MLLCWHDFFLPAKITSTILKLSRCWLGTKIAIAGDYTYVHKIRHCKPTGWPITIDVICKMRCIKFLRFFFLEFWISESEFWFLDFSTAEFEKNFLTRIFGIKNGIGILLPMGEWPNPHGEVGVRFKRVGDIKIVKRSVKSYVTILSGWCAVVGGIFASALS